MKTLKFFMVLSIWIFGYSSFIAGQQPTPKEIVKKAYDLMQGQTNESTMSMTIVRPTWQRTIAFKSWAKGNDYSLAIVTDPAKERGQTFLKRKNEIWNWVPSIQKMIKLPPSMMSQGWMGSDFSNDDLLKESSIVEDYEHSLLGTDKLEGQECYKIKLTPKPNAPVVWGSIIKWISKADYFQLRSEYYDEDGILIKTESASIIRQMGDRRIPTHIEIIPKDKPGNKTLVDIQKAIFNKPIEDSFFSQQNMKNVR
ncbi:MAG TPA: outer membrane lipoprotein-sorting protein [Bacteroidales bacterium]